jgi:hypothetical protein
LAALAVLGGFAVVCHVLDDVGDELSQARERTGPIAREVRETGEHGAGRDVFLVFHGPRDAVDNLFDGDAWSGHGVGCPGLGWGLVVFTFSVMVTARRPITAKASQI